MEKRSRDYINTLASLKEARQFYVEGTGKKPRVARVTKLLDAPTKKEVGEIRRRFQLTRDDMATVFNVKRRTIQSWELGTRYADGAAVVLFRLLQEDGKLLNKVKTLVKA